MVPQEEPPRKSQYPPKGIMSCVFDSELVNNGMAEIEPRDPEPETIEGSSLLSSVQMVGQIQGMSGDR